MCVTSLVCIIYVMRGPIKMLRVPCVSKRKNKGVRRVLKGMEREKDNSDVTHYARARIRKAEGTAQRAT